MLSFTTCGISFMAWAWTGTACMASARPIADENVEAALICLFITLPPEGCGRAFWPCRKVRPVAAKGYSANILFLRDKLPSRQQNFPMLRHPHPPSSVQGSKSEGQGSSTSGRRTEPLVQRADGTLDWSRAMASAQAGDQEAYRRLLQDITPYLRVLAARHIRNADDIQATVQDVLLTVHSVRGTYDPSRPFGPWLVAIANRRIVDGMRRRGRVSSQQTLVETQLETLPAEETTVQDERGECRVIKDAIANMTGETGA